MFSNMFSGDFWFKTTFKIIFILSNIPARKSDTIRNVFESAI